MVRIAFVTALLVGLALGSAHSADYKADLDGPKGEVVYFLLGMLDDYGGRNVIEDIPIVESFYCGEHEHAFVFRAYLEQLARDQHLPAEVEAKWRQDCLVSLYSPALSNFINQFYPLSFDSADSGRAKTDKGLKRMAHATLPAPVVLDQRRDLQLAFLAGTYFRYGNGNKVEFANSASKFHLVAELLSAVGCDSVNTASRAGLPAHNAILFHPTDQLTQAFKQWPSTWALERADTIVGLASPGELSIYEEIIKYAKQGTFDGCPLPARFATSRFTFIPLSRRRGDIPGASQAEREALADYDTLSVSLRSVRDLARGGVRVIVPGPYSFPNGDITLNRIGFSTDRHTAATFVFYSDGDTRTCWRGIAVFASDVSGTWQVTRYATMEHN